LVINRCCNFLLKIIEWSWKEIQKKFTPGGVCNRWFWTVEVMLNKKYVRGSISGGGSVRIFYGIVIIRIMGIKGRLWNRCLAVCVDTFIHGLSAFHLLEEAWTNIFGPLEIRREAYEGRRHEDPIKISNVIIITSDIGIFHPMDSKEADSNLLKVEGIDCNITGNKIPIQKEPWVLRSDFRKIQNYWTDDCNAWSEVFGVVAWNISLYPFITNSKKSGVSERWIPCNGTIKSDKLRGAGGRAGVR